MRVRPIPSLRHMGYALAASFCLLSLHPQLAHAQRGGGYEGTAVPWESTSQGFPGYFDTNMARKNSIVVEFPPMIYGLIPTPFMSVDYGVSDTLTVGTNAIVTTVPWLIQGEGLSLKVRSLVLGDDFQQAAATYYGGAFAVHGETRISAYYHAGTWNHALRFAKVHTLKAHANYLRLNIEQAPIDDLNHLEVGINTFMLGLGYGYQFSPTWAFTMDGTASIYQSLEADMASASLNQSSTIKSTQSTTTLGMAQLEYHSSDPWFFCFGITTFNVAGTSIGAPWFTWARRW